MKSIIKYCSIILLITLIIVIFEIRYPKVNHVSIRSSKINRGKQLKILQLSDIHNKIYLNKNDKLIKKIKELNPDIIVITGDLIDWKTREYGDIYLLVEKLAEVNANIYFVSGNHEWRNGNVEQLVKELTRRGITIINNSNEIFFNNNIQVNMCGIDDPYSNHDDLDTALNSIDRNLYTVLLSHSPNIIFKKDVSQIDLILSGHTHGGQIRLPGIGAIVVPGQKIFPKYDKGLFNVSESTKLYIDSGLGTSVYPIRLFNRSQMTLIKIQGI
ncbi:metallophosphoesterase [Brassicibacter mesophilus]|uniref:metallophosphoesterase n=1 Tax=Brassicibacter mesophilus TaxID=745119 RepID=UPI003D1D1AB5